MFRHFRNFLCFWKDCFEWVTFLPKGSRGDPDQWKAFNLYSSKVLQLQGIKIFFGGHGWESPPMSQKTIDSRLEFSVFCRQRRKSGHFFFLQHNFRCWGKKKASSWIFLVNFVKYPAWIGPLNDDCLANFYILRRKIQAVCSRNVKYSPSQVHRIVHNVM